MFPDVVPEHFESVTTPHVLLVPPYLWTGLDTLELSGKTAAFVMAVPITEPERRYVDEHGADALADRLEDADPDIVDLWRASII
ncbi:suppressor of fused domain protein [Pseudonocardia sp. HH130630-07]|uniref:suppressor of fused domain protein n=1 Tax=Pseudonocardia sp. HH130630-07 TaxID=1690815 RepID=UPI0018D410D8|nr:suppressor of fused domain protein [Pseudonocardia sp. HH130630-07]